MTKRQAYMKEWQAKNRDSLRAKSRLYYHAHREQQIANSKLYCSLVKETINRRYSDAKGKAKHREIDFFLTKEEFGKLVTNASCYYCHAKLAKTGIGLDRINNKEGYSLLNVLPCCWPCNQLRGNRLTVKETQIAMKAILKHRRSNEN